MTLAACEEVTATDLSRFPDAAFDAVLLLGPLYHLLEEEERRQAMAEAYRVLKPGGPLFAAFIPCYPALRWAAAHEGVSVPGTVRRSGHGACGPARGEAYRSHLGRFQFDRVTVEVRGDLHRREGEEWVPTWVRTETVVDVEGVPVRASWLEEEVLAYIRRGRLDRAAECLPHCDRARLLTLLRGEQIAGVL